MTIQTTRPARGLYADQLDEGIRNAVRAKRHLAKMDPARRAQLEAEWAEAEAVNDRVRIDAERRGIVSDFIEHSREARRG